LPLEVSGDLIAQEVGISLFLGGLPFVLDDDPDRLRSSLARTRQRLAHDGRRRDLEEIAP
jgi:hypothetical protein